jgi:hypothetical protein
MPDFNAYMSNYPAIPGISQAVIVARFIDEKPSVITIFNRDDAAVSGTQTVRIEPMSNQAREQMGANVVTEEEYVMVHGYKNHPTATNTDLRKGDRFTADNLTGSYDVINVVEAFADRLLVMAQVK